MFCSKCGKENLEDANFCAFCGAPLNDFTLGRANVKENTGTPEKRIVNWQHRLRAAIPL